ncbi:MAG TPA: response regulator, partial [Candidatus Xenobia bacterium]
QLAQSKGLDFRIDVDERLSDSIKTDPKRLQQILKNLLSNAFKFTDHGFVEFKMRVATGGWSIERDSLNEAETVIAFSVQDTGIGIPAEKHKIIFEAFQQADGTTSRQYGGTGLGLSISREIARLLGGEIKLVSERGEGSTFTLFLPLSYTPPPPVPARPAPTRAELRRVRAEAEEAAAEVPAPEVPKLEDDRDHWQAGQLSMLIIEDDPHFARLLLDLSREQGFQGLVAVTGEAGLALARDYQPSAVTLDLGLPSTDAFTVLDRLKRNPDTRHLPVHLVSTNGDYDRGLRMGAFSYIEKPVTRDELVSSLDVIKHYVTAPVRRLLLLARDEDDRNTVVGLVSGEGIDIHSVGSEAEAVEALLHDKYDCAIIHYRPGVQVFSLIDQMKSELGLTELPLIIYTPGSMDRDDDLLLRQWSRDVVLRDVRSPERLLDATCLYLHRPYQSLPEPSRQMLDRLYETDPIVGDRKILIVDDDVRNIFALTSLLERYNMRVLYAENGRDGIEALQENPDISLVLMDIMMPEMDGFETIRRVRLLPRFKALPIIALTAKAMKGDRDKCIDAGASDYIAKPVDTEQLLSLLRVWLYR